MGYNLAVDHLAEAEQEGSHLATWALTSNHLGPKLIMDNPDGGILPLDRPTEVGRNARGCNARRRPPLGLDPLPEIEHLRSKFSDRRLGPAVNLRFVRRIPSASRDRRCVRWALPRTES